MGRQEYIFAFYLALILAFGIVGYNKPFQGTGHEVEGGILMISIATTLSWFLWQQFGSKAV